MTDEYVFALSGSINITLMHPLLFTRIVCNSSRDKLVISVHAIEHSIEKWMSLKNSGRIENLNIIRYTNAHSNFFCIVDNEKRFLL